MTHTLEQAGAAAALEMQRGNTQAAAEIYDLIVAQVPGHAGAHNNHGNILQKLKRFDDALASYDKAIALKPDFADAYYNRGNALQEMRRYGEALASYDKAAALAPDDAEIHNNRGNVLQKMKRYEEALASYDKAIALKSNLAKAHNNRGLTLHALRRFDEALASYDKALALKPDDAEIYNNRSVALQEMRRYDEALVGTAKAIALQSDYAEAYNNRGITLQDMKRFDESLENYAKAIALKPDYADAYYNRGIALQETRRYEEALEDYAKAIALKRDYAEAYHNRGTILQKMQRFDDALASFDQAIAFEPGIPYVLGTMLRTKMLIAEWQGIDEIFGQLIKELAAGKPASPPFEMAVLPSSAAQQKKCAEIYIKNKIPPGAVKLWNGERYAHDKIRIGYFSADFQNHATAYLMAKLFELHDRSKFEITGFSFGPPSTDAMRKRLEKAFDRFIDVSAQSDLEIATLARSLEIDIAIDLKGFTRDSRTEIFALRPAPVQVNYLGFPGTMGASYIDYLIADSILIPEEHRRYYTEKIAYLPGSYQVNDSSRKISDKHFTRSELGLPEEGFVFCCFNNNYKITPDIFDIWMRLLQKVDGSVLWLFEGNPTAAKNLRAEAEKRNIAGHRLVFAKHMDVADHLARHWLADLFLDTFHCNAHTTASDALWAGLPLLTCLGETFAGRVAASLLNALDMPELITHSHADYETLALELATQPQKLSVLRQKLAQNRATSPLFDTALSTKHLEAAYIKMWEKTQAGLLPDDIYEPS